MKIGDLGGKFNILTFEEIEIVELPDDFPGSIISDFIERHRPGSQLPGLARQETGGIGIHNGGDKSWILKKQEWHYMAG